MHRKPHAHECSCSPGRMGHMYRYIVLHNPLDTIAAPQCSETHSNIPQRAYGNQSLNPLLTPLSTR